MPEESYKNRKAYNMQILFIESTVPDYHALANGVVDTRLIAIARHQDGIKHIVEQIQSISARKSSHITAHIISHGAPGCIYLGDTELSLSALSKYIDNIANLQPRFRT